MITTEEVVANNSPPMANNSNNILHNPTTPRTLAVTPLNQTTPLPLLNTNKVATQHHSRVMVSKINNTQLLPTTLATHLRTLQLHTASSKPHPMASLATLLPPLTDKLLTPTQTLLNHNMAITALAHLVSLAWANKWGQMASEA